MKTSRQLKDLINNIAKNNNISAQILLKQYIKTEVMAIDACTALSGKVNCVVIEDTKCKDNNKQ